MSFPATTASSSALSDPYNWCNGRCDACFLESSCAVRRHERRRELALRASGAVAPSAPELTVAQLLRAYQAVATTIRLLERLPPADRAPSPSPWLEGRSDPPGGAPVACLSSRRLYDAAREANLRIAIAASRAGLRDHPLRATSLRLVGKTARISGAGTGPSPTVLAALEHARVDTFPNILLIERDVAELASSLDALPPSKARDDARAALDTYVRLFGSWSRLVPDDLRAEVARLARERRAPPPFAERAPGGEDEDDDVLEIDLVDLEDEDDTLPMLPPPLPSETHLRLV